ncbi:ATP-binding cassette sub- D member 3 [Xenoophorus captivus]|uniref:ATP-binding cassette sub- D member 3 n=1 Tax=Xenoophorus captivus TaxID=1517983 RepID=A0ABV0RQ93_9TELE
MQLCCVFSFTLDAETAEKPILVPGSGQIINRDNIIKFDHTPLATPNGDLLIRDLTFEVRSGTNVLVCGPNGCGKSSLFRVLGECPLWKLNKHTGVLQTQRWLVPPRLWPLFGGSLTKPERGKLFYVPQVKLLSFFLAVWIMLKVKCIFETFSKCTSL